MENQKPCLILDIDETLVFSTIREKPSSSTQVLAKSLVRPGLGEFLEDLNEFYDIFIFTSAPQEYADKVLENIDKNKVIQKKFYFQDCDKSKIDGMEIKDLSKFGRDLKRCVFVDDVAAYAELQPENLILIRKFQGQMKDRELIYLKQFLLEIKDEEDLTKRLKDYSGFVAKLRKLGFKPEDKASDTTTNPGASVKKRFFSFLGSTKSTNVSDIKNEEVEPLVSFEVEYAKRK